MLWLFGQIWLWLLVAFALGALAGALLTWPARRRRASEAGTAEAAAHGASTDDTRTGAALTAPAATRAGPAGTATFGPVAAGSSTGPGAVSHGSGRQVHDPNSADHHRGRRRGPRTPDVEQARPTRTDEAGNHIIGTLDETTGAGRTSGTLPSRRAWHTRNEWPDEADEWATEHDIPRSGG